MMWSRAHVTFYALSSFLTRQLVLKHLYGTFYDLFSFPHLKTSSEAISTLSFPPCYILCFIFFPYSKTTIVLKHVYLLLHALLSCLTWKLVPKHIYLIPSCFVFFPTCNLNTSFEEVICYILWFVFFPLLENYSSIYVLHFMLSFLSLTMLQN